MANMDTQNCKYEYEGVTFIDASSVYIDKSVVIEKGAVIYPFVCLYGKTTIGRGSKIYSFCEFTDTAIGAMTEAHSTNAVSAIVGDNCTVGPFCCLRKGAVVGDNCRVGDYVEIKNSTLENKVKVAHLAYVGDSYVGEGTNVGCGAVFANYDGKVKQRVKVGKNVFIGCNANLIAPLDIGDNAYIAGGSTVTDDIPSDAFCIARSRQTIKNDWRR